MKHIINTFLHNENVLYVKKITFYNTKTTFVIMFITANVNLIVFLIVENNF